MTHRPPVRLERKDRAGARTGMEQRAFPLQIKAVGDAGQVEGYGAVFGNLDAWNDIILPGAFTASLAQHRQAGTLPAMLWQHDDSSPCGVWQEMTEDDKGLLVKGQLALGTTKGREAYELLKLQAISGLSIGFRAGVREYDPDTGIRLLKSVELWEVSLVTFPANDKARVSDVKSMHELAAPKDAERALRDAGFSKADATAFVSRVMRFGAERRDSAEALAKAHRSAQTLLANLKT